MDGYRLWEHLRADPGYHAYDGTGDSHVAPGNRGGLALLNDDPLREFGDSAAQ
jgi:hypothetical protein